MKNSTDENICCFIFFILCYAFWGFIFPLVCNVTFCEYKMSATSRSTKSSQKSMSFHPQNTLPSCLKRLVCSQGIWRMSICLMLHCFLMTLFTNQNQELSLKGTWASTECFRQVTRGCCSNVRYEKMKVFFNIHAGTQILAGPKNETITLLNNHKRNYWYEDESMNFCVPFGDVMKNTPDVIICDWFTWFLRCRVKVIVETEMLKK